MWASLMSSPYAGAITKSLGWTWSNFSPASVIRILTTDTPHSAAVVSALRNIRPNPANSHVVCSPSSRTSAPSWSLSSGIACIIGDGAVRDETVTLTILLMRGDMTGTALGSKLS